MHTSLLIPLVQIFPREVGVGAGVSSLVDRELGRGEAVESWGIVPEMLAEQEKEM